MSEQRRGRGGRPGSSTQERTETRALTVTLFDLAWLLPRTVGAEDRLPDPLPRSELEVMRLLGRRPGVGVTVLARELGLQASNASATVRSLVERGLVERRSTPDDGRQVLLFLTPAAQASRRERERRWAAELQGTLAMLTDAERESILLAAPALRSLAGLLANPDVGEQ